VSKPRDSSGMPITQDQYDGLMRAVKNYGLMVEALEVRLAIYGRHTPECEVRNVGCDPSVLVCICGWSSKIKD
jgi:hypothetical protein